MRGPTRREVVIGSAVAHAASLFGLIWWARGLEAFASVGPWVVVLGAGSALGAEAGMRRQEERVEPRAFDTAIGISLLVLVVFAALRADGGLVPFVGAALIGVGMGFRVMASQEADGVFRFAPELGLAALAGGFAVLVFHPYAAVGWAVVMGLAITRRVRAG